MRTLVVGASGTIGKWLYKEFGNAKLNMTECALPYLRFARISSDVVGHQDFDENRAPLSRVSSRIII